MTPRAIGASLDEYRTCPCCHGPSSLFLSTGMGGNGTKDAATAELSAEQAADKFAALLGLNQTPETEFESPPHEKSRCEDATEELCRLWGTLMPGEENPTNPIICAFCAKYLPSLVASYKAEPCAFGPHYRMLVAVLQSNYFAKFMRTPQGSELYAFFVDNIITSNHPLRPSWASSSLRPTRTNINCTSSPCPRTFAHSWTTGFARRRHIVWDSFRLLTSPAPPPYRKRKQSKGGAARGQRRGPRRLMLVSTRESCRTSSRVYAFRVLDFSFLSFFRFTHSLVSFSSTESSTSSRAASAMRRCSSRSLDGRRSTATLCCTRTSTNICGRKVISEMMRVMWLRARRERAKPNSAASSAGAAIPSRIAVKCTRRKIGLCTSNGVSRRCT
ncbi:hypothetical protein B0H13DRAFT_1978742, partial [Mycena leptocephala]